jgi:diguanylate cyclase (GGDEF)-like protein
VEVDRVSRAYHASAQRQAAEMQRTGVQMLIGTSFGFGIGLTLVGVIWRLVLSYQRRLLQDADASEHRSLHDPLTGLPNRRMFHEHLSDSVGTASSRRGDQVGIMIIDLDGFKAVNDEFGHEAGDELLTGFANLLRGTVSRADTVGRLGGDEFAVVLTDIGRAENAVAVALRLLDALRRPLTVAGRPLVGRASIGIALSQPGDTGRLIMHRADQAMYRAKRASTGWSLEGGTPVADPAPAAQVDPAVSAP